MQGNKLEKLAEIAKLPAPIQQITLAAYLAKLFLEKGVKLNVVGGAAVQYYTHAEYVTHDLDAILYFDTKEIIESIMLGLGFKRTNMYRHFENSVFNFVVEFPPAPVEIGSREVVQLNSIDTPEGAVRVVKIEDLIMDRIIAGVEWRSEESISQAKLLWAKCKNIIDYPYLEEFAKSEGYLDTLNKITGK